MIEKDDWRAAIDRSEGYWNRRLEILRVHQTTLLWLSLIANMIASAALTCAIIAL